LKHRTLPLLVACAVTFGCAGDVRFLEPDDGGGNGDGGGDLRADLTVTAVLASQDAAIGTILGWSSGRIEGAEVVIRRTGQNETSVQVTDSLGRATFTEILVGNYQISVRRMLSELEEERLREEDEFSDVDVFGGGRALSVSAPSRSEEIEVAAGRSGSLVISEFFRASPQSETDGYNLGHYIEFYNNSDSTIYMDGKILGYGVSPLVEHIDITCSSTERWRLDPVAIWSKFHVRFPGHGTQYPVLPGRAVVLAMDAIDHSEFWPGLPDLSGADFESIGTQDPDNPAVPNMIDVGFQPWRSATGHGMFFSPGIYFLTVPLDLSQLPAEEVPTFGTREHRGFPAGAVLDVAVFQHPHSVIDELPNSDGACEKLISESFDLSPFHDLPPSREIVSTHRKVLTTLSDGRRVLQRTRTSALDFEVREYSPGRVP
jgi:hypothetical protein